MPHDWLLELRGRINTQMALCPADDRALIDHHLISANHSPCADSHERCFCARLWPCAWAREAAARYGVAIGAVYANVPEPASVLTAS
ncbi:MAG: hypothetical protein HOQ07_13410 [Sinomonas sp.]|nr:hypothetical protein [Sinomonas sp.]